jgi:hypothetical protein
MVALGALAAAPSTHAYGVLTHLAIVDAAWGDTLVPVLRQRFPDLTEDDLVRAHAGAYGGALAQDMGYYPGGSRALGDLVHYVRPADFVRAVERTYGVPLTAFLPRPDRAVRSFRKFVATLFPKATRVAWAYKKDEIQAALPGATSERFVYTLSNAAFEKEWGRDYDRPGLGSRVGAFLLRFVPKVGGLRILIPKPPTAEGERIFEDSFTTVVDDYRGQVRGERPALANVNLDVGAPTAPGTYPRADAAWADLRARLGTEDAAASSRASR